MATPQRNAHRPHIVIIGAGFGGLSAAMALANSDLAVTLVDRHNYHLFQPLLYQVATAALSPADIASPIRAIMRRYTNVSVILANVSGIDLNRREVIAEDHRIGFDALVVATGAQHAYFGHDEWASFAPGLKTIDDATYLRRRILLAFEKAETETDPQERRRLLNFVVVGGGPTGVEMAGAVAELAKRALATDFRAIDPRQANVILVEAAPRLLTPFDERLSAAAKLALEEIGVEVRLGVGVTGGDCAGVSLGDARIEARTVIWAAGVMASPAGLWLGAKTDRAGRVLVEPDLSLPGRRDVFVIGDAACALGPDGKPLPGVAPVAKQQGAYVARLIKARAEARNQTAPFRYRDAGALATIGRRRAVAQIGPFKLNGFAAWLLWCVAHIYFLIGFRNRAIVATNWAWNYITFQRGTRLITGMTGARMEAMPAPVSKEPNNSGDVRHAA
jgi:NADH dehydrogenase